MIQTCTTDDKAGQTELSAKSLKEEAVSEHTGSTESPPLVIFDKRLYVNLTKQNQSSFWGRPACRMSKVL